MKTIIAGVTVCAAVVKFNVQLPVDITGVIIAGAVILAVVFLAGLRNTNQY